MENSNYLLLIQISVKKHITQNLSKHSSAILMDPVYSIPNAIDMKKWKPVDKNLSRKTLKLPNELSLILFGSTSGTKDYHKGFDLLEKSMEKLQSIWTWTNI